MLARVIFMTTPSRKATSRPSAIARLIQAFDNPEYSAACLIVRKGLGLTSGGRTADAMRSTSSTARATPGGSPSSVMVTAVVAISGGIGGSTRGGLAAA